MHVRSTTVAILIAFLSASTPAGVGSQTAESPRLTVHEWGTFTSIAGEDGQALQWLPQGGANDLPCFVDSNVFNIKGSLWGTVRMETPVLYFYTPSDVTVDVKVGFKQGVITEWYPRAFVSANPARTDGAIAWDKVRISPSIAPRFPREPGKSHYYLARDVDATPLRVGLQTERFLFYRGVGYLQPPISAKIGPDGRTVVWDSLNKAIGDVILFENRHGAVSYSVQRAAGGRITLDRPALDDESTAPKRELVSLLMANGLYRKEAEAMVATWSDSWFEEGTRLFYIVPRAAVDAILPLTIAPAPTEVARVFVGRMELMTPAALAEVGRALEADDRTTMAKYGRFLYPIATRAIAASPVDRRALLSARLQAAAAVWGKPAKLCE
jgi:hypothetical protein